MQRILRRTSEAGERYKGIFVAFLLICFVEVFIFNFRYWESLTFINPQAFTELSAGSGLEETVDHEFIVKNAETAYIEYSNIDMHIDNLLFEINQLDWTSTSWRDAGGPYINLHLQVTDEGSSSYFNLPQITYVVGKAQTHWNRVYLSGKTNSIRVYFDVPEGTILEIGKLTANSIRPFHISLARVVILALIAAIFLSLRSKSILYEMKLDTKSRRIMALIAAITVAEITSGLIVGRITSNGEIDSPGQVNEVVYDFNQYNHVADAILSCSLSLDIPVSESLNTMDNPYDLTARSRILQEAGEAYYLDYAYYKGKYYSYFGVLPAIAFYVPYKLATGQDLSTANVVAVLGILYILAANFLLINVLRKARGVDASVGDFSIGSVSLIGTSGFLYLLYLPQVYSVPILMSLALLFLGIGIWINEEIHHEDGIYSKRRLAAGALSVALTLLCRPQQFLCVLIAFAIFWKGISKERSFFSVKGFANTAAIVAPCLAIGVIAMIYNYLRFGFGLDFGATYNLTGSDMTHRGIVLGRVLPAIFQYLFQPIIITASYPYIQAANMNVNYQGFWFYEPYLGGFFWFCPIVFIVFTLKSWITQNKETGLKSFVMSLISIAMLLLFLDFQIASITTRYFNDFAWLLVIASLTIVWTTQSSEKESNVLLRKVPAILVIVGLTLNITALFSEGRYAPMSSSCPSLYYGVKAWLTN